MYNTDQKRKVLINLINMYLKKEHIKSRYLFKFYKDRLLNNKYLTEKQFRHLLKYIVYDLQMTPHQCKLTFSELVSERKEPQYSGNDLTPFFI